ncbi:transmembrane protein 242 [Strongylocentrotus purpuratus]|uniref:Transmembrane protein 242 n=1 Tax=Strongylocentrotus purpuratus TaxID=7668 RepID=A0A7M7REV9_STRPU|nr:transmembrane protein 242 [Strongylocentrotus purpuratus]|eukprot:XP_786165.1 PREDICTED: transmembrane protein 242 [Strongylocentrotus purpuratus]
MAAPIGSKNESPSSKIESQNNLHGKSDQSGSTNIKKIAFMVAVSGMAMLGGFGMTLAKTKRRHPSSFSKGIVPDPSVELHESGASLGMRALGWGTVWSIVGVGSFTFLFCKALGVKNVEELKTKFQSVAPAIRRNETEPEEVIIARFKEEILKDERTNSDTD